MEHFYLYITMMKYTSFDISNVLLSTMVIYVDSLENINITLI